MRESDFQSALKKEIRNRFPGCYVLKADSADIQGIPDLLILYGDTWASLEVKKNEYEANKRPKDNQHYYVADMNSMSFSSFIYPENKEEVLDDLARLFEKHSARKSRFVWSK